MAEYRRISVAKQEEARYKKQRSKLLFNNEALSDVKFVVRVFGNGESPNSKRSKIVIPAHKFVLSISSPVFFSMFCGEMAESGEQIDLPDCEYEGMFELLRYIYTDEVSLNENNVLQVLYVAEKYLVPCLAKECVKFLLRNLTNLDSSNVLCVLKHAEQYKKEDLLGLCWFLIDKKAGEALSSSEFLLIEKSLLEQVVERSTLDIKEIELFKAVDRWAEKECERQNLTVNGSAKRQVLGEKIFTNIRFPVMEKSEFMEVVLNSKMLTTNETTNMMNYFSCTLTTTVGFLEAERSSCLRCCRCNASLGSGTKGMKNRLDSPHFIEITVDEDILLYGVGMFGYGDADYSVTLKISNQDGSLLATKSGAYTSFLMQPETESPYDGFLVLFDVPLTLNKGIKYGFKASLDGISIIKTFVVEDVICAGVAFSFKDPHIVHADEEEDECYGMPTGQLAELFFKVKP